MVIGTVANDVAIGSCAPLQTIDLALLKEGSTCESTRLLAACREHGFFYLDLQRNDAFLQDWTAVLHIMTVYFAQDLDVKTRDSRASDTHGYEPVATSAGAVSSLPDYYESLKASRDEIINRDNALASVVAANYGLFERFVNTAHEAVMIILARLDTALNLGDTMQNFHRDHRPSLTTLSMFRYPKQESIDVGVGHNKHTDLGTLTFLLCQSWGLQVLCRDPAGWRFVAPKQGHAIINVGDTLRFLSGNRLRSAVHRVIPLGELQLQDRYSIAYFLRAENNTSFTDSNGRIVSAKAWHDEKFDVFRETHEQQERAMILTGGMERDEMVIS